MQQAIAGGAGFFQYRCKNGSRRTIYDTAVRLARIARESGALFIVNDHADIALAVGADGVHLGQEDLPLEFARKLLGPDKVIGISTHDLEQAARAERAGADYIGFGPVFETTTKAAGQSRGVVNLSAVCASVTVPVIAIGGIQVANVQDVLRSGAEGVAVISAIAAAPDIQQAVHTMLMSIAAFRRN